MSTPEKAEVGHQTFHASADGSPFGPPSCGFKPEPGESAWVTTVANDVNCHLCNDSVPDVEGQQRLRNGHLLDLRETDWRCLTCGHWFESTADADLFQCGEDCKGKHPGDPRTPPAGGEVR